MGGVGHQGRSCPLRTHRNERSAVPHRSPLLWAIVAATSFSSATLLQERAASQPAASAAAGSATPATEPSAHHLATQGHLGHPYTLPPASRTRMHECGVEWQRRKMSGEAGDEIWRVFASLCLVAPEGKTRSVQLPTSNR